MNKIVKILLVIFTSLIAFITAFIIYYGAKTTDPNDNNNKNETEEFYDENLDQDGWI